MSLLKNKQNSEKKSQTLEARIRKSIISLFVSIGTLIILFSSYVMAEDYLQSYNVRINELVNIYADVLDGDQIRNYVETGVKDEEYYALKKDLDNVKENSENLSYFYVFVPYEDHFVYVVEGQTPEDDPKYISDLGEVFEYTSIEYEHLVPDIKEAKSSDRLMFIPNALTLYSIAAWAPVFDSNGQVAAMVEADYTIEDMLLELIINIVSIAVVVMLGLFGIMLALLKMIKDDVAVPVGKLSSYVDSYKDGKYTLERPSLKHDDEIMQLLEAFNNMGIRIDEYTDKLTSVTVEKERIGAELNVAKNIQAGMLPKNFSAFCDGKEFDIHATMTPAKEVGGDFYDFFMIDDDHVALVMADVSGKGVPASLFMAIAKTLIKKRAQSGGTPAEILFDVNNQICEGNDSGLFVTVWLAVIEISSGKVITANAGHEYPLVMRKDGEFEFIKDPHSSALSAFDDAEYTNFEFTISAGDKIFAYTDGVPEATNGDNILFGNDRLVASLNKRKSEELYELLVGLKADIDEFVGTAPQFDDVTMLCFEYMGSKKMQMNNFELTIEASLDKLDVVNEFVDKCLEGYDYSMKFRLSLDLVVEELFVNVAHYAYEDKGDLKICAEITDNKALKMTFIDSGIPYNPLLKEDPDITQKAEDRNIGGLGIFLVKMNVDDIAYEYTDNKNCLTIVKNIM